MATSAGVPVTSCSTNVSAGWNMIGSVVDSVGFTAPEDNPDGSMKKSLVKV